MLSPVKEPPRMCLCSLMASISPTRKDPTNRVQQMDQKSFLLTEGHFEALSRWRMSRRTAGVTGIFAFGWNDLGKNWFPGWDSGKAYLGLGFLSPSYSRLGKGGDSGLPAEALHGVEFSHLGVKMLQYTGTEIRYKIHSKTV